MKSKKYIYAIVIILLAICGIVSYFSSRNENPVKRDFFQIEKEGVLRIVTDYSSSGYYVSQDTVAGFNNDLIRLLQQYTPIHIEVSAEGQIDKLMSGLRNGKYDVVATDIPITSELRDSLGFTKPILFDKLVLVQRKQQYNDGKEPIRSHLDLAKKTLYIPENSPAILRIRNLSHEIGDTIYYIEDPLYGTEQLAMMVATGEIDYTVCDEKNIFTLSQSLPEIDFATYIGFTHIEAWAVRPNAPLLLDSLNCWLEKVQQTKEYNALLKKYYNQGR